jgi:actin-related protein 6
LTNHLKHLISFRQWNMADETHVVNEVKEACCYVSMDWKRDVEICKYVPLSRLVFELTSRENPKKNPIVQEYVLPDHSGSTSTTGYIRSGPNAEPREQQTKKGNTEDEEEQVLWMGNERFMGPELLFNPSDIGQSIFKSRG